MRSLNVPACDSDEEEVVPQVVLPSIHEDERSKDCPSPMEPPKRFSRNRLGSFDLSAASDLADSEPTSFADRKLAMRRGMAKWSSDSKVISMRRFATEDLHEEPVDREAMLQARRSHNQQVGIDIARSGEGRPLPDMLLLTCGKNEFRTTKLAEEASK
ncbi:hypothetical protein GUITHDRAFT_156114 [Guillardia theta CCMP2712]|uniref:Uncharacterized protein n=1 Tax=Guillardia theta (strain CCMP2712) TaxID=905079 RepID=L1IAH3_GUITC|nr:hypothetical protein GUITHDRAFT_156114 [Guillardia theta CCMP2712]EKX33228.1 hypothetical protein GUITHDRAFT_156114 [Guillardia theta CCMP2712]|eukprot:XP_005820208.1 hypothetical protein GUITHDRAFT_156114 [Guillardia theta CCMP2712]